MESGSCEWVEVPAHGEGLFVEIEPSRPNEFGGAAVWSAARAESGVEWAEGVLQFPSDTVCADVFDEHEFAVLFEDTVDLGEGTAWIVDTTEDECRDDGVEAAGGKRHVFSGTCDDNCGRGGLIEPALQSFAHVPVGLEQDEPRGVLVVGDVEPGSSPDLENVTIEVAQEGVTAFAKTGALDAAEKRVVCACEEFLCELAPASPADVATRS